MVYNLLTALLFILVSCNQNSLVIHPLHPIITTQNDTVLQGVRAGGVMEKYYYIQNFSDRKKNINEVRRFAEKEVQGEAKKYTHIIVLFFKKTNVLNDSYRETDDDQLSYHQKDLLFEFRWFKGQAFPFKQYKNGDCVNCNTFNYHLIDTVPH
jgi:hypothetical protein